MALTLLIGGARAGKSELAVRLASATGGPVVFVATAAVVDEEMAERIRRHRDARPSEWKTIEEQTDLVGAFDDAGSEACVVLDCLTLWVNNLMLEGLDDEDIYARAEESAARAAQREPTTIVVTNEVGAGVHPPTELGRRFRDVLGRVNAIWSRPATDVFLVVAGRTLPLDPPPSKDAQP